MPPSTRHKRLRWLLAFISAAILVVVLAFTLINWATTSLAEGMELKHFNEVLNESVQIRLGISSNLFQLAVIITGALWGVVIAKEDESGIVFADRQEIVMFCCASLLLLTSLLSYIIYSSRVAYIYELADLTNQPDSPIMIGDFFNPIISNFFAYQITNLVFGIVIAFVTLISSHKLK
ncbi:MAG TPA: hypothetical protein VGW12_13145 [Pyrinomonadaceae bacterium]|nr:hypothetical protein [Pyrinomonadaceae bacterium]